MKYSGSGKQIIEFPSGTTNFPFPDKYWEPIVIHMYNKDFIVDTKNYNQAVDWAIKQVFREIVKHNPANSSVANSANSVLKGEVPYAVLLVDPLSNKVTISNQGAKWPKDNCNSIVHFFDFNFLLKYKSNKNSTSDYLNGMKNATTYSAVNADIYGAAFHNDVWKGRRLILGGEK